MTASEIKVRTESLDKVTELLISGLTTDGADHKQWYMEKALRELAGDDFTDRAMFEFEWDEGIVP